MTDDEFRKGRIEKLLAEVEYEITRGVLNRDIDEAMSFEFIIPVSTHGEDWCVQFVARMKPVPRWQIGNNGRRLELLRGGKE